MQKHSPTLFFALFRLRIASDVFCSAFLPTSSSMHLAKFGSTTSAYLGYRPKQQQRLHVLDIHTYVYPYV